MTAKEYIYYGFGQIVYGLAFADGKIQLEERSKLEQLLTKELSKEIGIEVTGIIFQLLGKDNMLSTQDAFKQGIANIKLGDNHLSKSMINIFVLTLQKVAEAFPPSTDEEKQIIQSFKETFNHIN